jgi:hypothetical protein
VLPVHIGTNLEVRYKGKTAAERDGTLRILELNRVADSILHTVYAAAGATRPDGQKRNRRVIFSSFQTTVSTANVLEFWTATESSNHTFRSV